MSKADDLQRLAEAFADLSIKFVRELPDHPIAKRLGTQFLDASTSVAANYRAARRGKSHDDFTAKWGTFRKRRTSLRTGLDVSRSQES
jgi:four helix bundle protein